MQFLEKLTSRKKLFGSVVLPVVLLLLSSLIFSVSFNVNEASAAPNKRLGFWLQEPVIFMGASSFFNAYFLTPPYPSFLEMNIVYPHILDSMVLFNQMAALTDKYPAIRISFNIGFDPKIQSQWQELQQFVNTMKNHPSVYSIGVMYEYFTGCTATDLQRFQTIVLSSGKQFISYYHVPDPYNQIYHTNFPAGDYESVLNYGIGDQHVQGLSAGYYGVFTFPETRSLPTNPTTRITYGWNHQIVDTVIAHIVQPSATNYLLNALCVGFSKTNFVGVSGKSTNQLWDNPTLRGWIWDNPNYKTNFILSTTPVTTTTLTNTITSTTIPLTTITLPITTTTTTTTSSSSTTKTEILRPTGDSNGQFSMYPSNGKSAYSTVSEIVSDGDTTYIYASSGNAKVSFTFNSLSVSKATISNVRLNVNAKHINSAVLDYFRFSLQTNSGTYYSKDFREGTTYSTFSIDYAKNPNTGAAWTVSEVNSLSAGLFRYYGAAGSDQGRYTQYWIEVTYTTT